VDLDSISKLDDSMLQNKPAVLAVMKLLQEAMCANSAEHGFWEKERNKPEMIALMHSELSEALEALRKPDTESVIDEGPVAEELADCVIRIMDYCEGFGIDLGHAIWEKYWYNRKRDYKHGKEF